MHQEKILPIKWNGWDQHDTTVFSFYEVEFTEHFGVFYKGEKYSSVFVDYSKGLLEAFTNDEDSEVAKTQFFTSVPIDTQFVFKISDWSKTPGPVHKREGVYSFEEYWKTIASPLSTCIITNSPIIFDFDGTAGFGGGFIESLFDYLLMMGEIDYLKQKISIVSEEEPRILEYYNQLCQEY